MKKTVLFILGFLFVVSLAFADDIWTLDFESSGGYTTTPSNITQEYSDYFGRFQETEISATFTNDQGIYFFAAQDIDGLFYDGSQPVTLPVYFDVDDISISGYTGLSFSVFLAEDDDGTNQDWDAADYVHILYDIDNSGSYTNLIWVEAEFALTNQIPKIDTDFDGLGDGTEITDAFTQFSNSITGTGSVIDIQIIFSLDSGDEDIAIDNLLIIGTPTGGVLNPTSFTATTASTTQIDLAWTENASGNDVLIAWNSLDTFGTPVDGTSYSSGTGIPGGGTSLGTDSDEAYSHSPLTSGTQYFYKIWSVDSSTDYSSGITADATTHKAEPTNHVTGFTATADGISVIDLAWTENDGSVVPDGYLIKASIADNVSAPVDGTEVADNTTIGNDSGAVNMAHGTTSYNWSGLEPNTIYYFEIYPYTNSGTAINYKIDGTIPGDNDTTDNNIATIPYSQTFTTDLGDCYTYNVSGATKEWYQTGDYAACNGYDSGDLEEDWLILPGINLDDYSNEMMSFDAWYQYGVAEDATDYLKLHYSTDYSGSGTPAGSSWIELSFTKPSSASTWTGSGDIDLSGISGTSVWIALEYHYDSGKYKSWRIDNISIAEVAGPTITNIISTPANPNTSQTVSVSADVVDGDGISSVELHWGTASGSLGTTISMSNGGSGDTYTTSTDIPAQSEGTTVYYEVYAVDTNTNPTTSDEFSYFVTDAVAPTAGVVYISEVSDDNVGGYQTAFMEIYNNSLDIIDMENSYIERWSSTGSYDNYTYTFGSGIIIPADGVLIVARGADQATFETAWSITISSLNASFDQGSTNLYFTTGRSYKLYSPSSRDVLDTTPVVDSGNRIVQTSIGTWSSQESSSNATPGNLDSGQILPITLTNFTAQFINDNLTILWTTQSETNNLGWNIYRGETENALENNTIFCLNNSVLIPGAGTTSEPTDYQFTDEYDVIVGQTYWYWLESIDGGGNTDTYGPATLTVPEEEPVPQLPQNTFLCSNYPNPFNPETKIEFSIKEGENGSLTIYNTKGQLLETYQYEAGEHQLKWDATQYGSGIYFYKLETQSYTETKKMIMLK